MNSELQTYCSGKKTKQTNTNYVYIYTHRNIHIYAYQSLFLINLYEKLKSWMRISQFASSYYVLFGTSASRNGFSG